MAPLAQEITLPVEYRDPRIRISVGYEYRVPAESNVRRSAEMIRHIVRSASRADRHFQRAIVGKAQHLLALHIRDPDIVCIIDRQAVRHYRLAGAPATQQLTVAREHENYRLFDRIGRKRLFPIASGTLKHEDMPVAVGIDGADFAPGDAFRDFRPIAINFGARRVFRLCLARTCRQGQCGKKRYPLHDGKGPRNTNTAPAAISMKPIAWFSPGRIPNNAQATITKPIKEHISAMVLSSASE